ncbi:hypothetical protein L5515_017233 [Caenorhabditis briggsae]|uniref:Uncharacterized protein n=1 Tax=Caenorhabditis briggsae TaxID=6238 RepID=A0AAE9FDB5_CAEBR|nr:hypothetical protein L5515_017233 [Caenorhabditis briggsae]
MDFGEIFTYFSEYSWSYLLYLFIEDLKNPINEWGFEIFFLLVCPEKRSVHLHQHSFHLQPNQQKPFNEDEATPWDVQEVLQKNKSAEEGSEG